MTVPTAGRGDARDDPRLRDDGLGWVSRALFDSAQIRLSLAHGRAPTDHWRTVARFAVLPDVARARFLLPLGSPRVTAASVLSYNALRGLGTRLTRQALGVLARAGVAQLPLCPVLTVQVAADVDTRNVFVVHHLAEALGDGALQAAIGVRPPDPNHKPTVQLFDRTGRPRGYAKVGWNPATRALVRAEMTALSTVAYEGSGDHPLVPRLRHGGDWAGRSIAVVAPLPADIRRVPRSSWPYPAAMLAVARRDAGPADRVALGASSFLAGLTERARQAVEQGCQSAHRAVRAVRALRLAHPGTNLEFGAWHGDWVPWNLGTHQGRLVAWDWEHSGTDAPLGFDLAHHAFQRALTLARSPVPVAADRAAEALSQHGPALGLDPVAQEAVLDAYLIELWLRTWRLASGDAGWNEQLHPALLDLLDDRLREPGAA